MTKAPFWQNKKVLITGHTGFKGSWLCLWLHTLGAEIHGIALDPPTQPNFFDCANIRTLLASDQRLNICDLASLKQSIAKLQPELIFHLAAQPLVAYSYQAPIETYAVNVMGTAHVLEAIRFCESAQAAVLVTTDKCYENRENRQAYRELDKLGGADPYSSSKACAEFVCSAYRASFFSSTRKMNLATARAGNVIGGGDWAANRLIPDCIRAFANKESVKLRYPHAIRPWQHVLESISGYIKLAEHLYHENGLDFAEAWNFGPRKDDMQTAFEVASQVCQLLNVPITQVNPDHDAHEASLLLLDSDKAKTYLGWSPRWDLKQAIDATISWYKHWQEMGDMLAFSQAQIKNYG